MLRYEECCAKLVLELLYSDRYSNLIIKDKPDLIDEEKNVGIEVTSCTSKGKQEAISLWAGIANGKSKKPKSDIERMAQLGFEYQEIVQTWEPKEEAEEIKEFILSVKIKLDKLGTYKDLLNYDLYVLSEMYISEEQRANVLNSLAEINVHEKKFRYIYLETNENTLISFDMEKMIIEEKSFDTKQYAIAIQAEKISDGEL